MRNCGHFCAGIVWEWCEKYYFRWILLLSAGGYCAIFGYHALAILGEI